MLYQFILRGAAKIDWTSKNCGNSRKVTGFTKNTPGTSWNFAKHGTSPKPWVLDEMVKRLFVNVLGPPKICQVLADLIADRNRKAQKANKHIGQGDARFRDSNSKGQPNLPRKSQPCPSSSSVGFIPRTRMASPRRSARNPSGREKCAKTISMDVMISLDLWLRNLRHQVIAKNYPGNSKDSTKKISYHNIYLSSVGICDRFLICLLAIQADSKDCSDMSTPWRAHCGPGQSMAKHGETIHFKNTVCYDMIWYDMVWYDIDKYKCI